MRLNDRMAVVMDKETVHAFAEDTEVSKGRTLLTDGAVIEAESEPRGISGLVRNGSPAAARCSPGDVFGPGECGMLDS